MMPGALWKRLSIVTKKSLAIEISSSTARDPMKQPAPGWRSFCKEKESQEFAPLPEGSMPGMQTSFHWFLHLQRDGWQLRSLSEIGSSLWWIRGQNNFAIDCETIPTV
jgi:hypothetical protein